MDLSRSDILALLLSLLKDSLTKFLLTAPLRSPQAGQSYGSHAELDDGVDAGTKEDVDQGGRYFHGVQADLTQLWASVWCRGTCFRFARYAAGVGDHCQGTSRGTVSHVDATSIILIGSNHFPQLLNVRALANKACAPIQTRQANPREASLQPYKPILCTEYSNYFGIHDRTRVQDVLETGFLKHTSS